MGFNRRRAGPDHEVVTVSDGPAMSYRRTPCETCPWRRDAVGEFPAEAFRMSAATGYESPALMDQTVGTAAMHTFACHSSGSKRPATCAGYILGSEHSIGWRIAVSLGRFRPSLVSNGGHELFASYREMAEANGVSPDDPILRYCR